MVLPTTEIKSQFSRHNQPLAGVRCQHGKLLRCENPDCWNEYRRSQVEPLPDTTEEMPFHCSADWHLWRLCPRGYAAQIYNHARRVAYKSKMFHASAANVANYFGWSERTVTRNFNLLVGYGFFEIATVSRGLTTNFRVFSHDEWKKSHPGKCPTKVFAARELTVHDPELEKRGYELGERLYNASGSRIKFKNWQTVNCLRTGLPMDTIVELFEEWYGGQESLNADRKGWRRHAPKKFYEYLTMKAASC